MLQIMSTIIVFNFLSIKTRQIFNHLFWSKNRNTGDIWRIILGAG